MTQNKNSCTGIVATSTLQNLKNSASGTVKNSMRYFMKLQIIQPEK